jgi:AcrR family transcriptional regulator
MDNGQCPHGEVMTKKIKNPTARDTYRHGDLRHALLEAGIELARAGGPDAIVLREATRRAGVVPNAAYRHFASRQELLLAVRAYTLSELAIAIENEIATLEEDPLSVEFARGCLRAVGIGYLRFAHAEPGLFRTAFSVPLNDESEADPARAGRSGLNPFQLLGAALDRLVDTGGLPPERRLGAEYLAWSAVHGLAVLFTDGPLRNLTDAQRSVVGQRVVEMVEKGL